MQRPAVPTMPWPLRRAIAIQRQRNPWLVIQLYDIVDHTGTTVGTYDRVGNHESNYESEWEENNKDVGVSYYLDNPHETGAPLPAGTVALVHAHTTSNGQRIEGVSVKKQSAAGQVQWVASRNLNDATAAELSRQMRAHALSPLRITNLRKIARETGTWPAGFTPGENDAAKRRSDRETIYYVNSDQFTANKVAVPTELYDAHGDRRANIYTTSSGAQAAIDSGNFASPSWYVAPAPPSAAAASGSSAASAPSKASAKRAKKKASLLEEELAKREKEKRAKEKITLKEEEIEDELVSNTSSSSDSTNASAGYSNWAYAGASAGASAGAAIVIAAARVVKSMLQQKPAPETLPVPALLPLEPTTSPLQTGRVRATSSPASSFTGIAQLVTAPRAYRLDTLMQRIPQAVAVPALRPPLGSAQPVYRPACSIQSAARPAIAPRNLASRPGPAPPVYRPAPPIQPKMYPISTPASQPCPGSAPPVYRPTYPTSR